MSIGQKKIAAEILGNISVAWFTVGVISPLFTKQKDWTVITMGFVIGLMMTIIFMSSSLLIVKGVKS